LHEVFSNTPGGSWTLFDIIRPSTGDVYRWDHMPMVPEAKRPDWVLQFDEGKVMSFLTIESKQNLQDFYPEMGELLTQFFTSTKEFLGIRNRPAWHKKDRGSDGWKFIPPEEDETIRFWFKKYDDPLVKFWAGFAFALNPEHYERTDSVDKDKLLDSMTNLLIRNKDIAVVIAVGWKERYHLPFVLRVYSEDFEKTRFATELDKLLKPALLG